MWLEFEHVTVLARVVLASIHSSASALIKMIWYTTHPWYA